MTERWRQRRLHVENRLAELNAKYGPIEQAPLPDWLDSLEGFIAANTPEPIPPAPEPPPDTGAVWDRDPI